MTRKTSVSDLKDRLLFLLFALFIYRVGSHIPVPGLDPARISALLSQSKSGGILGLFNLFSGGSLSRLTVFSLGIMPYISSSIIIQLLTTALPSFEQLKKEGQVGRRKLSKYTRYLTLVLSIFQSFGMAKFILNGSTQTFMGVFTVIVTLVAGTMFLMWLGEQITERGVGNGISMMIFAGIVTSLPMAIANTLEKVRQGDLHPLGLLMLLVMLAVVIASIVFIERGERRVIIHHAEKVKGRRVYPAYQSHQPFKINKAGVIPPIFASSIILFPATLAQWFGKSQNLEWLVKFSQLITPGQPIYVALFAIAIIFFSFFYTALIFNPKEAAEDLQKLGGVIQGIRPGEQTAKYLDGIATRLTLVGALYIAAVSLMPEFLVLFMDVPFYFGGTSLLIIVVVVMEFKAQIDASVINSEQYENLMKKSKLR